MRSRRGEQLAYEPATWCLLSVVEARSFARAARQLGLTLMEHRPTSEQRTSHLEATLSATPGLPGSRIAAGQKQAGGLTGLLILVMVSYSTNLYTNMARTHSDKRSRLVSAAVGLAYQNGFGATSLADIAREAEVPVGNVFYYKWRSDPNFEPLRL
jgi:hypothetical protein